MAGVDLRLLPPWGSSESSYGRTEEQLLLELLELLRDGLTIVFEIFVVVSLLCMVICLVTCTPAAAHRIGEHVIGDLWTL